ncbi:MAG: GNAT family N-acetyltransferase [Bacteroidetes bacterium]|nr:GNAT family N-acetyltransferase [Bacteroidota bacterium]
MIFHKYGITLERLKEGDIEMVRQWRNSDPVRLNMNYREIITRKQQREWFQSINNEKFHYVVIQYQGEKIGLLNDKNIDWDSLTSETGIFIGRPEFYHTFVPYLVSVAGIEYLFHLLGWKKQFAHIMRSNRNAIKYNLELGYRLCEGQKDEECQLYELTRESFEEAAGKIRKMVRSISSGNTKSKILLEHEDYKTGIAQKFESLLNANPHHLVREETEEGIWYLEAEDTMVVK